MFPGKGIPLPAAVDSSGNTPRENELASGSSLATAFAAGLAGVIIYASRALSYLDPDLSPREHELLESNTKLERIEESFKVLGGTSNQTAAVDLFVGLGSHFPRDPLKGRRRRRRRPGPGGKEILDGAATLIMMATNWYRRKQNICSLILPAQSIRSYKLVHAHLFVHR